MNLAGGLVLLLGLTACHCSGQPQGAAGGRQRRGIAARQIYSAPVPFAHFPYLGGLAHPFPSVPAPSIAVAELRSPTDDSIRGRIVFTQTHTPNGPVFMSGNITGLSQGKHGLTVHAFGDTSNGCESMGPHYNPRLVNHGGPADPFRHVGDLGNIEVGSDGVGRLSETDHVISLCGAESIVGRGLVIHENPDDLGRGGDMESLRTGNSGNSVACGIIGWSNHAMSSVTTDNGSTATGGGEESAGEDLAKRKRRGN